MTSYKMSHGNTMSEAIKKCKEKCKQLGNNTKIRYLNAANNKIYEVTNISFFYMTIEAVETDLTTDDVPKDELWDIREFERYKVKLVNNCGIGKIIDFEKYKKNRKVQM